MMKHLLAKESQHVLSQSATEAVFVILLFVMAENLGLLYIFFFFCLRDSVKYSNSPAPGQSRA